MKMRCCVLLVLFLHCLGGSGLPLFELSSKADDALRMALDEINAHFARLHLYRVSKATVTRVIPLGMNTYDMMLKFGIRETECRKGSGIEPQGCAYRRGFFVLEAGCHIRARLSERLTNIVFLNATQHKVLAPSPVKRCGPDGTMIQIALPVEILYLRLRRQALMHLHRYILGAMVTSTFVKII